MDFNYYVMVLKKVNNDWRINWFVSTNPPEYVDTVTSDQQHDTSTRASGRAPQPLVSARPSKYVPCSAASGPQSISGFRGHIRIN
jgi:hypothetical protein